MLLEINYAMSLIKSKLLKLILILSCIKYYYYKGLKIPNDLP